MPPPPPPRCTKPTASLPAAGLSFYSTAEEALQGAVLTGKAAIVTGGNAGVPCPGPHAATGRQGRAATLSTAPPSPPCAGLGAETVRVLAGAGADVIMCSRSTSRGQEAADRIATGLAAAAAAAAGAGKPAPAPGKITVVPLDLADLRSVQAFAQHPAVAGLKAIHLLVLNAGRHSPAPPASPGCCKLLPARLLMHANASCSGPATQASWACPASS